MFLNDEEYLEAWGELRSDAIDAFSFASIPSTALLNWMAWRRVPRNQQIFYHAVIRTIDNNAVAYKSKKSED